MGETLIDGRYELGGVLASDRFGEVYEAVQINLNRAVSIKILAAKEAGPEAIGRFRREAAVLARLHHPGIVFVIDFGVHDGRPYIVRDIAGGETLEERMAARGRFLPEDVVPILLQIAEALDHAHAAGVVHRDLEPRNIVFTEGRARVVDFGLARLCGEEDGLTAPGVVVGRSWSMSPEQARGEPADARSDLYSLGVIAFRLLAGHHPFEANTLEELAAKLAKEKAPPAGAGLDLPKEAGSLCAAVDRLLARDPADRFPAASWVVNALQAAATDLALPDATVDAELLRTNAALPPPPPPRGKSDEWSIVSSSSVAKEISEEGQSLEEWIVPSLAPSPRSTLDIEPPGGWERQRENVKLVAGALYLVALAAVTFYFVVGLPDAARDVRGMIRARQALQVIPQLERYTSAPDADPRLRAALGQAFVHAKKPRKALAELGRAAAKDPAALEEADVAAIVPMLGLGDAGSLEAHALIEKLGERAKGRVERARDGASDPYFRCRAGAVLASLGERADFVPDCLSTLERQHCGARAVVIPLLANEPRARPILERLAAVTSSTAEACGQREAREALAK
jgi:serine/threonine-protein kinase